MKVILLAPTPPPAGGIAGWTVRMMNAKLNNGWQVRVVDEKAIGNRQVFGKKGKRNILEEWKRCHNIWTELKIALEDDDAKIVHSCIPSVTFAMMREYVCAAITKHKRRKFIIHFRCTVPNTTRGRLGHFMLKKLCNKSDLIMVLNSESMEYLKTISNTPVVLIPNFISEDELEKEHMIRENIETVLYVGGIVENKGIPMVLQLAQMYPDIQFRLIGEGDASYKDQVNQLGLKNVVFAGQKPREQVKKELAMADVFLFPTHFRGEGFSNALCEAMAAGLPCIVTDWAANADMIGDDGGIVVKVGDVNAAAEAIQKMESDEIRRSMSRRNIKKVNDEYVDRVVLGKYVDAYESLL